MQAVEAFIRGKDPDAARCEDGIVISRDFAAVIDGATDKTGLRYEGMTGGIFAMRGCADAVRALDPAASASDAVAALTEALAARLPPDCLPQERPTAVLAMYSCQRREIWQIGDVGLWHDGLPAGGMRPEKVIDRHAAALRAAILDAHLADGTPGEQLAEHDPGRDAIVPLLVQGWVFCNNPGAGSWAYAAINGLPVPGHLVTVHPVPKQVSEVVLASDGYPRILPTLDETEQALSGLLAEDPLCIGPLLGTKGVRRGNYSFDDRAYLRLRV